MIGFDLGDLYIAGKYPPKLLKACAVIADRLHPSLDDVPLIERGKSKRSCILASATVRDFLRSIGFSDAEMRPVTVVMMAERGGEILHSVGIGAPGQPDEGDGWAGHMVVTVPSARALIDTTLYQTRRDAWKDLSGMIATKLRPRPDLRYFDLMQLAGLMRGDGDYAFRIVWLDNPENQRWRQAPDTDPDRRRRAVAAMVEQFGKWEGRRAA